MSNGVELRRVGMGETDGGAKAITWPAGACNGEEEHDVVLTAAKVLLLRTNATVTRARRHEMCSGLCDGRLARILSVAWFMAGLEEAAMLKGIRLSHCLHAIMIPQSRCQLCQLIILKRDENDKQKHASHRK